MSSLLVDIGNSRLKWAVKYPGVLEVGRSIEAISRDSDLNRIWKKLEPPARVLVSNVHGDGFRQRLQEWVQRHWSLSVEFVRSCSKGYGIESGYLHPDQLGVDRWISMVAARSLFQESVCIVDCGTAITADVLDSMGRHQGGVICPGITLMQDALIRGTSELLLEGIASCELLGRDTSTGIYSGTLLAAAGMIEKLLKETEQSMQTGLKLIVTGGAAEVVVKRLGSGYELIPDLVLRGLSVIESGENIEGSED